MKVIFIVGLPRSGTTVFGQNFSKRFNSLYLGESHADSQFFKGKNHIKKEVFINLINFVRKRIFLNDKLDQIWKEQNKFYIKSNKTRFTFEDWIEFLYSFGIKSKLDCIIDDTPTNYFYLNRPIYDQKKLYIFLIKRKLKDILSSHIKSPWGHNKVPGIFMFKYSYFYHLMLKIKNLPNSTILNYESIGIFLKKN